MSANRAIRRLAKRIQELKDENAQLLYDLEEYGYQAWAAEERSCAERMRAEREMRTLQEETRRVREEAESRGYDQQRIVRDLERAQDWKRITGHDPFDDVGRCIRKLRRLG